MKKASFGKRAWAHIIDLFIIGIIVSIITMNVSNTRVSTLNKDMNNLMNSYLKGDITVEKYVGEYANITYDINKFTIVSSIVYLAVSTFYFLIFQYINGGASIGKKLMKIKIVNKDNKDVSFLQMFIRTSIVNEIIPELMMILLIYSTSGISYLVSYGIIGFITNIFIIICVIMLLIGKEKVALNDIMSKSYVVEC